MLRFTPEFLDELKSRLTPSGVIGRYVKLRKQGHEWAGLSPFTKEKTPSFFVNDQKGFYHCFSSGKHGDVIGFLVDTQGLTFPEAVARLAEEAGVPLPASEPEEAERGRRRKSLSEACAAAVAFYAQKLHAPEGRAAAAYLAGRGVGAEAIAAFRLGYSPASRTALKETLLSQGFSEGTLLEAGLVIKPDDGGASYDRFRGRLMFPILSATGQPIAFGGRALEKDAKPKYLNSPETTLFHKGDVLYNFGAARKAALEKGAPFIVCEGYMDVIALAGAGFPTAVAPLGTALGETQLSLLWRHGDEPVICLDGDSAGVAAAYRTIDRALPLLTPGKSLSFVFLPDNQDPDDLIRAGGRAAFGAALKDAAPLADVLWRREVEARPLDTPERRAALRAHLRELVKSIADKDVRSAYGAEFAARLDAVAPRREPPPKPESRGYVASGAVAGPRRGRGFRQPIDPRLTARPTSALVAKGAPHAFRQEAVLVLTLIRHPDLFERAEADILSLTLDTRELQDLLEGAVAAILSAEGLDSEKLEGHLRQGPSSEILERVLKDEALNAQTFLRATAEQHVVDRGWRDAFRIHVHGRLALQEVADTAAGLHAPNGEESWKAAVKHREQAHHSAEDANDGDPRRGREIDESLARLKANIERRQRRKG